MQLSMLSNTRATRWAISILLFLMAFSVYVFHFMYSASGDTVATELLAVTLIREGNFDYNEFFEEGEEMPYSFTYSGDRIVNLYSVVTGMMNVPVFLAADLAGIDMEENLLPLNKVTMSLLAALSTVMMFRILLVRKFSIGLSTLMALVFASGTLVWSVAARGAWQHGPSIFFLTTGMLLFFSKNRKAFAWAGFFFAMMSINRPVNSIIVIPFYIYTFVHNRKNIVPLVLTSLIPVAFLAWYSLEYWGTLLSLGQGQGQKFTSSPWLGVPGLLISPSRGILIFSPVFVFSFVYLIKKVFTKGGDILYRYLSTGFFVTLFIYSIWEEWYGGHCFGYRYLSEYIPLMIIFLAESWSIYIKPRVWTRILFVLLFTVSVYIQFLGAVIYPSGFNRIPNNIDFHRERLWQIRDTELIRLSKIFTQRVSAKI